jgi:hypothetical protein
VVPSTVRSTCWRREECDANRPAWTQLWVENYVFSALPRNRTTKEENSSMSRTLLFASTVVPRGRRRRSQLELSL